jgi:hypothetical protein
MLPGGFECNPTEIEEGAWQDHIARHVLGAHGKRFGSGPAPWNYEGWDATVPPIITAKMRKDLVRKIGELHSDGRTCLVPQFTNRPEPVRAPDVAYCKRCDTEVRRSCVALCHGSDGVGLRYGELIDDFLQGVEEGRGELVKQYDLKLRLMSTAASKTEKLHEVVVASWGFPPDHPSPVVRISRGDGTRVEFYATGKQLRWRTTYREGSSDQSKSFALAPWARQFLTQFPKETPSLGALSDRCIVPRLWWRNHAH